VTDNDSLSDEQVRLLHGWFVREMIDLARAPAPSDTRGGLLLGGLVYGEKYIERFQNLCMPSLNASGNAKALHRRSRMILFTDGAGYGALHDFQRQREIAGYPTQLFVLPQSLMDSLTALTGLLGGTQNLGVQIAARYGMAYHPVFPDHVYSPDYFPNLLKLGKRYPAIAQSSISANDTLALRSGLLAHDFAVPAADLGTLGLENIHAQSAGNLMVDGTYPTSHQIIWQGRDRLHVHCPHMNPVYISPDLCAAAPTQYLSIIDANLPYIFGDEFYVPTVSDDMAFLEVSDDSKASVTERVSMERFAAVCRSNLKFRTIYMPYFERGCEVPIRPQEKFLTEADIKQRHKAVCDAILGRTVPGHVDYKKEAA
jgi:hypothetical protein